MESKNVLGRCFNQFMRGVKLWKDTHELANILVELLLKPQGKNKQGCFYLLYV